MKPPVWVTRDECVAMHEMMLAQYGGLASIRDEGLLESALAKPRHLYAYGTPGLAAMAGSYAVGIIKNHPFLDGNKRTGFVVAAVFLEVNGVIFRASEESVVENTLALAGSTISETEYVAWLQANLQLVARRPSKSRE